MAAGGAVTNGRLRRSRLAGPPGVAAVIALATACNGGPVTRATEHMASAELARAAVAGYPARVVLEEQTSTTAPREDETLLVIGPDSVRVVPSPAFTPLANAGFDRWLRRVWVGPYLEASDLDGAVRAAAHGYVRALIDERVIARGVPLPPLPPPNRWAFAFPSRNADWGLPMAVAVFALAVALSRFSKRSSGRREG